jgi:hypothetical protein
MKVDGRDLTHTERLALLREEYAALGIWTEYRHEPASHPSRADSPLADAHSAPLTPAIREAFAPLDSYRVASQPLRDREATSFLMVPQAG